MAIKGSTGHYDISKSSRLNFNGTISSVQMYNKYFSLLIIDSPFLAEADVAINTIFSGITGSLLF